MHSNILYGKKFSMVGYTYNFPLLRRHRTYISFFRYYPTLQNNNYDMVEKLHYKGNTMLWYQVLLIWPVCFDDLLEICAILSTFC